LKGGAHLRERVAALGFERGQLVAVVGAGVAVVLLDVEARVFEPLRDLDLGAGGGGGGKDAEAVAVPFVFDDNVD
jgi:hypothetical protein